MLNVVTGGEEIAAAVLIRGSVNIGTRKIEGKYLLIPYNGMNCLQILPV